VSETSGAPGIKIGSVFKLKDSINTDSTARDNDESLYSQYKQDADIFREEYFTPIQSTFFRCLADTDRRKREVFERAVFGRKVSDPTDETVPTTTTPSKTTISTTTPTTPTTKFTTKEKPRVTEKHATETKDALQGEIKTTAPEDVALDELFVHEKSQVEEEFDVEEFDIEAIEMEIDATSSLDLEPPSDYLVVEPETGVTEPSEPEEPTKFKQMEETPELSKWELNVGSLILFVGLLAGVTIVIIFKIGVTMNRKQEGQVKNDYKYTQLCES